MTKYERRMKPGLREDLQREFPEWVKDMDYESLLASEMLKAWMWEAFVGGWGAKTRAMKRKKKRNENGTS